MSLRKYASEVIREGKRVRWPKREDLLPAIFVVVLIAAFAAIVLGALENVFKSL
ncbi:MAG: preprotein translocase subunit SecE [Firmicutes bacterium]|nr:preprotein translocase subunit SecE [Bacillota bacterium]